MGFFMFPASVKGAHEIAGPAGGGKNDRTRTVMDAVLGGLRTGCGQVGDATRVITGQKA
ncbi:hypothetical protein ABT301_17335 [Streptomyces sp. NPDC000987]|uniref:hypothetical protein n=1 Tax=Streptomyces sp. NPDC000987 TaxID=3154374 RepID=UPI0033334E20